MCLRATRYYNEAGKGEESEGGGGGGGGVWERIRGRPEASVIYTCLSAKDTPLTVNHAAAVRTQKNLWSHSGASLRERQTRQPDRTQQQQQHSTTQVQIFSNCSLDLWFSTGGVPGPTSLFFTSS